MSLRVGILGGTFDPVHNGHIESVIELAGRLRLDQVRLLPVGQHALKSGAVASAQQRKAMLEIAAAPHPQLRVDDRELHGKGVSYSIDTCRALRSEFGASASLFFIVGSDVVPELHLWRHWQQLLEVVNLVVMQRAGAMVGQPEPVAEVAALLAGAVQDIEKTHGQVASLKLAAHDVSSTQLREQLLQRDSAQPRAKYCGRLMARLRRFARPGPHGNQSKTHDNQPEPHSKQPEPQTGQAGVTWQQALPAGVLEYIEQQHLYEAGAN